jgi:hypothetical protein
MAYAAGLFTYAATHERWLAAMGTLLGVSGLQLAVMRTIDPAVGAVFAALGLVMVGRDLATIVADRLARPATVAARSHRERELG